jgi:hypothetical protein
MGLDQYAVASKEDLRERPECAGTASEIAYWRKHNRLQGYMEDLYRERHMEDSNKPFNCVYLELMPSDIDELEGVIKEALLPETSGFFFGPDSYRDPEHLKYLVEADLHFIRRARCAFEDGFRVWYYSWW